MFFGKWALLQRASPLSLPCWPNLQAFVASRQKPSLGQILKYRCAHSTVIGCSHKVLTLQFNWEKLFINNLEYQQKNSVMPSETVTHQLMTIKPLQCSKNEPSNEPILLLPLASSGTISPENSLFPHHLSPLPVPFSSKIAATVQLTLVFV